MRKHRLLSWNVNGLRAVHKKGFMDFVGAIRPDILCLQEIKANEDQLPEELREFDDYQAFFHSAEKKGYSGTAIYTRVRPKNVQYGMGIDYHDNEGRLITMEFEDFYLVNVYVPNARHELVRLPYRQQWDRDFLDYLKSLEQHKPVIFCGDLNVAHQEIDLANPEQNRRNPGFTDEEREGVSNMLSAGFVDTFREVNPQPHNYTWWSYRSNARERNVGWRIDYFCASEKMCERLEWAFILPEVTGSDHCPVGIDMML